MERVCKFLKDAKVYYIATLDGDQPRVRPFGTAHIFNGKLYIQSGKKKDFAKQIEKNPKVEICAMNGGDWIRIDTTLVEDNNLEAQASLLEDYPELKGMYAVGDGNNVVYYLKDSIATIFSFTKEPIVIKF